MDNNICKKNTIICIVTPSFNSQETISRTITSVVSQAGDFDIYYHIQDGGSTDNTLSIIERWQKLLISGNYPILCNYIKFTYDSSPDKGMYDAIVKGFDTLLPQEEGWLSWINSDDFYVQGAFATIDKVNQSSSLSCIIEWITGACSINRETMPVSSFNRALTSSFIKAGLMDGKFWDFIQQEGTFFKRSLWNKINKTDGFSHLKYAGDWNLWRQFAEYTEIYQFKYPLASFSIRNGQLSQAARAEYEKETEEIVSTKDRLNSFKNIDVENIKSLYFSASFKNESIEIEKKNIISQYISKAKYLEIDYTHEKNVLAKEEYKTMTKTIKFTIQKIRYYIEKLKSFNGFNYVKQIKKKTHTLSYYNNCISFDKEWQYPATTEQHAFLMLSIYNTTYDQDSIYIAFPWATLIDLLDRKIDRSSIFLDALAHIKKKISGKKNIITVCQHIRLLSHQSLFSKLGITHIFWSHATKGQTNLPEHNHIKIYPFPLYPVQAMHKNHPKFDKQYLFSFVGLGSHNSYLTKSRELIVNLLSKDKRGFIQSRDAWHYKKIVYGHQIKKELDSKDNLIDNNASEEFQAIASQSIFTLCPSGTGPNTIRLWEAIGLGSIPVILSDTYLPPGNLKLWDEAVVYCEETNEAIHSLSDRLEAMAKNPELLARKRQAMRQLWMIYGPDCFVYDVKKLLLSLN